MDPNIWGPHFWNTINALALSYPDKPDVQDQNNAINCLTSLGNILPCEVCRNHFKQNLKKFPLSQSLTSREHFIKWVIDVHNSVNKGNGKRIYTYEEGIKEMKYNLRIQNTYGMNTISNSKYQIIFTLSIGVMIFWSLRKTKFFKNLLK